MFLKNNHITYIILAAIIHKPLRKHLVIESKKQKWAVTNCVKCWYEETCLVDEFSIFFVFLEDKCTLFFEGFWRISFTMKWKMLRLYFEDGDDKLLRPPIYLMA